MPACGKDEDVGRGVVADKAVALAVGDAVGVGEAVLAGPPVPGVEVGEEVGLDVVVGEVVGDAGVAVGEAVAAATASERVLHCVSWGACAGAFLGAVGATGSWRIS